MVVSCPRDPLLGRRLLQCRGEAREVIEKRVQVLVCINGIWKTGRVLYSWFVVGICQFSLARVPYLEFDDVSGVLPHANSFNGNGFDFAKLFWRYVKLHVNEGVASS